MENTTTRNVVRNLTNEKALTVTEDTALLGTPELMVDTSQHPPSVLCGKKVAGIISRIDIVRALLDRTKSTNE